MRSVRQTYLSHFDNPIIFSTEAHSFYRIWNARNPERCFIGKFNIIEYVCYNNNRYSYGIHLEAIRKNEILDD